MISSLKDPSRPADFSNRSPEPHIVLIIPRGEAIRNFLYSDTLKALGEQSRVTILSVVSDEETLDKIRPYCNQIISLKEYPKRWPERYLRDITEWAHRRWLWSYAAQSLWNIHAHQARLDGSTWKWILKTTFARLFASRPALRLLTALEQELSWRLRTTHEFERLFQRIKPDLVFNGSHIHGNASELPMKVAARLGIPTAGFIFSWDNLTSRGRIFVPYNHILVWHQQMKDKLLELYPEIGAKHVHITGTPQFDFHFKPDNWLSRQELCDQLGLDPTCPFILYTTGMDVDFPEEHHTVEAVIEYLDSLDSANKPQLVVRTYVKGTSQEMKELAARRHPDVVFPPVKWDEKWFTPHTDDYPIYTGLLRHTALGINAASTVSLELMMHNKPVINIGFDPPGSHLPPVYRWERHLQFDHYRPVVASGGTQVAHSIDEMKQLISSSLANPEAYSQQRHAFIQDTFGNTLDGKSGQRVAETLLNLAITPG